MNSIDRWIRKVTIPADRRSIRVSKGGSILTVSIPAGDYWCHASPSFLYPGLYAAIATALQTTVDASFQVRAHSPYSLYPQCGIEFVRDSSPTPFVFHLSSPGWTLDRRLLGWPASHNADVTSVDSVLRAPMSTWGSWVAPRPAKRKIAYPERRAHWATEDSARADVYQVDFGTRIKRVFQYDWCQASLIHPRRAELEDHAAAAGLLAGDTHNAFQTIWESLAQLDDVLVVHDQAQQAGLLIGGFGWEALRIANADTARRFEECAQLVNAGGEFYGLVVPTVQVGGTYGQ